MTSLDIPFTGARHARLDSSLRLCLRADWRILAGKLLYLFFSRENGHACIKVLTKKSYEARVQIILRHDKLTDTEKSDRVRHFEMLSSVVMADSRNRILIPRGLASMSGLEKSGVAKLVGRGDHFVILLVFSNATITNSTSSAQNHP